MRRIERTHREGLSTHVKCMVKKEEQLPPLKTMLKPVDPEQTPVLEMD